MAGFHTKTFLNHDDYMTPKHAWEDIKQFIPPNKLIWECFYGDGQSGKDLQEVLGNNNEVCHEPRDFFLTSSQQIIDLNMTLISNPPFSLKKEVFTRLKELGQPFIMISPSAMLQTQYIRQLFSDSDDPLQIIIPRKRIQFLKKVDGEVPKDYISRCNFDCFYYCWKINLPRDIIWLN